MPVKYNIVSPRDIKQQSNDRFDYKLDRRQPIRAVVCDEFGNNSGSGDIWYDRSKRRVWIRELGTSSASIVACYTVTPEIGLGVMVGWRPYSNVKEVLSSDIEFLGQTNTTGTSYESPSNLDFLPGGRLQLWLQSKLIQPLATYPSTSGLVVNVVGGDYIYNGVRTTYAGRTNIDLSASQPAAGQYRFVGLYLDSTNTLQTVNGTAGATTPPAEPTWPTGAFQLSVVRLYNPQTKVNLKLDTDADNDIFDRRIIWTDVDSFDIWPYDKILTVSPTNAFANFTTIQDAIDYQEANSLQDVIILCDPAVYTETLTFTLGSVCLASLGVNGEVVVTSTDAITITINASNVTLRNITIDNDETGTNGTCVQIAANRDGTIFDNCRFNVTNATVTNAYGVDVNGGDTTGTLFRECTFFLDAGATLNTAIDVATDCIVLVEDGQIESLGATNYAINSASGAVVRLVMPRILSGSFNGSGTQGLYIDSSGNTRIINGNYVYGNISGTGRPNPLVNGDFLVWQRGTSFAAAANATYTADKYVYNKSGAMVDTVSQSTDVPTVAQAGIKVPYSLLIDCTTADGSIAAGDFCVLNHWMEGFNFLDLAQRQFTLSFWVKATKAGVYCVAFRNAGGDRSYVAEYTINATDTWEFKTITVDASPTAGTWDYTTGIGLGVGFTRAGGSTFQTTAGAWQTGNFFSTANQVNACDDAANNFRLALINISPGPIAPSPRLPDYEAELARCLRYAYVLDNSTNTINNGLGAKVSTTLIQVQFPLPVPMRIAPTLSHNISGYTAGVPGTTTVGLVDFARNGFYAITGALTVTGVANKYFGLLNFTAGTSWDGTAGNVTAMRIGPSVIAVFSADF